ncbi:MAG: pyridoxal-phosphate dependent enzyme [Yoonia sp.]|uniref:pyridoxal-phosphate dependent enzyme n=1 Tax=Yoonia sp. TaxID=2212373 RepID=UPI0032637166
MDILANPHTPLSGLEDVPWPSSDADRPMALLQRCPAAAITPLVSVPELAAMTGVAHVSVKDERARMGLGSFKALGAAYVIACDAEAGAAKGQTYVTASAGNHGLSVAAGAAAFGAKAVVYLSQSVPKAFADRLAAMGATVVRHGDIYEDSMAGAQAAAMEKGWTLLSDSSWGGYMDRPHRLMEGYLTLMAEAVDQMDAPPSHIFLQAGVGGLAVACATYARKVWGASPTIVIVEPNAAPAIHASIAAGSAQTTTGPVSSMGRLDCKEPSLIALKGLARDTDFFALISEDEGQKGADVSATLGLPSTPSGAAGIAALLAASGHQAELGLTPSSHVLCILSEEAT